MTATIAGVVIRFDCAAALRDREFNNHRWAKALERFERGAGQIANVEEVRGPDITSCYTVMFNGRRSPEWYRQRVAQVGERAFR